MQGLLCGCGVPSVLPILQGWFLQPGCSSSLFRMVNSDNEVQVLKNGRKPSVSRPSSPAGHGANGQGSESSEDEREGLTNRIFGVCTGTYKPSRKKHRFLADIVRFGTDIVVKGSFPNIISFTV